MAGRRGLQRLPARLGPSLTFIADQSRAERSEQTCSKPAPAAPRLTPLRPDALPPAPARRRAFNLPEDSELNITFTCDEPTTGAAPEEQPPPPSWSPSSEPRILHCPRCLRFARTYSYMHAARLRTHAWCTRTRVPTPGARAHVCPHLPHAPTPRLRCACAAWHAAPLRRRPIVPPAPTPLACRRWVAADAPRRGGVRCGGALRLGLRRAPHVHAHPHPAHHVGCVW